MPVRDSFSHLLYLVFILVEEVNKPRTVEKELPLSLHIIMVKEYLKKTREESVWQVFLFYAEAGFESNEGKVTETAGSVFINFFPLHIKGAKLVSLNCQQGLVIPPALIRNIQ